MPLPRRTDRPGKPPTGQHPVNPGLKKTVVDQPDHAPVVRGADHPAGGLSHFLQARDEVGVVVTVAKALLKTVFEHLMPGVKGRQAQGCHKGANQLIPGQIDTLAEYPPKYRKRHTPLRFPEPRSEERRVGKESRTRRPPRTVK